MTDVNRILHILRNPWGFDHCEIKINALKASDLIERSANPWISVDSRLPDDLDNVLVTYNEWGSPAETSRMYRFEGSWCSSEGECTIPEDYMVTHWMPLLGPAR